MTSRIACLTPVSAVNRRGDVADGDRFVPGIAERFFFRRSVLCTTSTNFTLTETGLPTPRTAVRATASQPVRRPSASGGPHNSFERRNEEPCPLWPREELHVSTERSIVT
jgi:hypothetical protein